MTTPRRFLVRMTVFLVAVIALSAALVEAIIPAFVTNPGLNGLIIGIILLGILLNLRAVVRLGPEVRWVNGFRRDDSNAPVFSDERHAVPPRLLAPMATMFQEHRNRARFTLSAPAMRSLLDGIAARLDEERDLSRYFIGLCIFLGLLGTFWGLMHTVGAISEVIGSLEVTGQQEITAMFGQLKQGLDGPLRGMGTAFSSSLFGLTGSLVLGFLDLQTGQAQSSFYNELEDWLSAITRLSGGGGVGDGEQSVPFYIQALLEQTAESIDELQRTISRGEDNRTASMSFQRDLIDRLTSLTDQMRAEQQVMLKLAESQIEMRTIMSRLADGAAGARSPGAMAGGMDDNTRSHIRSIDLSLGRLIEESSRGREELGKEIRSEIKLLARTIAAIAEDGR